MSEEDQPSASAAERAREFGIDLSLTYGNMFARTPAERLAELDRHIDEHVGRTRPTFEGRLSEES